MPVIGTNHKILEQIRETDHCACNNKPGKTKEIRELLKGSSLEIKNLTDFGPIPEVIEDGTTFDDNAYKKASFTSRVLGYPAMADDSGLCVEALDVHPACIPPGMRGKRHRPGECE